MIEALNNGLKHSGADTIDVDIRSSEDGLRLIIQDNGRGFNYDATHLSGIGLSSMKERVKKLGGLLSIESTPGKGTRIIVKLGKPGE